MPWFRVDDRLTSHVKWLRLPHDKKAPALGLWVQAGTWSSLNLKDGFVPCDILGHFGTDRDIADVLVSAGYWEKAPNGYQFVDWDEYQPTRSSVGDKRAADAERKRRSRATSNSGHTDVTPDISGRVQSHALSTLPDPSRTKEKKSGRKRPATTLPTDWAPTDSHRKLATDRGIDCDHEATQFRLHAEANDRRQASWNAAFSQWLGNARPKLRAVNAGREPGGRLWQE